jgi:hypothetical protein
MAVDHEENDFSGQHDQIGTVRPPVAGARVVCELYSAARAQSQT